MTFTPQHKLRLYYAIQMWLGTPYVAGQSLPGIGGGGVDCVRFCYDVLERTYELPGKPLPRLAQDAAFHDKAVVQAVTRHFWERFDWFSVKKGLPLMPADMLAVRKKTPHPHDDPEPHHVFLVGPDRVRCYHSWPGIGVQMVGIGGLRAAFDILHVYRSGLGYVKPR